MRVERNLAPIFFLVNPTASSAPKFCTGRREAFFDKTIVEKCFAPTMISFRVIFFLLANFARFAIMPNEMNVRETKLVEA